jgi:hypothetical protein
MRQRLATIIIRRIILLLNRTERQSPNRRGNRLRTCKPRRRIQLPHLQRLLPHPLRSLLWFIRSQTLLGFPTRRRFDSASTVSFPFLKTLHN